MKSFNKKEKGGGVKPEIKQNIIMGLITSTLACHICLRMGADQLILSKYIYIKRKGKLCIGRIVLISSTKPYFSCATKWAAVAKRRQNCPLSKSTGKPRQMK